MRRRLFAALVALLLIGVALPAMAITDGEEDIDDDYPYVGQLLFHVPDYPDDRFPDLGGWFTCSGALLEDGEAASDFVVVTAGHCTFAVGFNGETTTDIDGDGAGGDSPAVTGGFWGDGNHTQNGVGGNDIWVSFDRSSDFSMIDPSSSFATNADRYAQWSTALDASPKWTRGVADTHPYYNDAAFVFFDLGVVTLGSDPGVDGEAILPSPGYLDDFIGKKKARSRFTPVGFGLERGFPYFAGGDTRMLADNMIIDATGVFGIGTIAPGTSIVFTNDRGQAHRGGTCFGDSGGPTFYEDSTTTVAVGSFGVNPTCMGIGGAYRIDKALDLDWIAGH